MNWTQVIAACVVVVGAIWSVGLFLHQTVTERLDGHQARMDRIATAAQKADIEALSRITRMETLVLERALEVLVRTQVQEQLPEVVEEIVEEGVDP